MMITCTKVIKQVNTGRKNDKMMMKKHIKKKKIEIIFPFVFFCHSGLHRDAVRSRRRGRVYYGL